ncbi:hypothetical protein V5799_008507 [Amblyomma americanum]|uniref:Uncharacterized protein n=1 Tax=Amblyomma americanum TaxID=6943 RepID=A0AAQ4FD29_AMBAM
MVPTPSREAFNLPAPPDFLAEVLRDLRGYQPPSDVSGVNDASHEYRLLIVLRALQDIQMALDVLQANQELALDQLGQKIVFLESIVAGIVHREYIDR